MLFFTLRQQSHTVQGLLKHNSEFVSSNMVKFAEKITPESIVLVEGTVKAPLDDVTSCTVQKVEIHVSKVRLRFSLHLHSHVNIAWADSCHFGGPYRASFPYG